MSAEAQLNTAEGICVLTYDPLDIGQIVKSVGDDSAGATTVFVGTTRNSFEGE
jgi:molybdopterin synthase catalytic subunit